MLGQMMEPVTWEAVELPSSSQKLGTKGKMRRTKVYPMYGIIPRELENFNRTGKEIPADGREDSAGKYLEKKTT